MTATCRGGDKDLQVMVLQIDSAGEPMAAYIDGLRNLPQHLASSRESDGKPVGPCWLVSIYDQTFYDIERRRSATGVVPD